MAAVVSRGFLGCGLVIAWASEVAYYSVDVWIVGVCSSTPSPTMSRQCFSAERTRSSPRRPTRLWVLVSCCDRGLRNNLSARNLVFGGRPPASRQATAATYARASGPSPVRFEYSLAVPHRQHSCGELSVNHAEGGVKLVLRVGQGGAPDSSRSDMGRGCNCTTWHKGCGLSFATSQRPVT